MSLTVRLLKRIRLNILFRDEKLEPNCLFILLQLVMARFETNMSWAKIELQGIEKGNGTTLTRIHNLSEIDIDPVSICVLSRSLPTPSQTTFTPLPSLQLPYHSNNVRINIKTNG
jgi:hypothetical protein